MIKYALFVVLLFTAGITWCQSNKPRIVYTKDKKPVMYFERTALTDVVTFICDQKKIYYMVNPDLSKQTFSGRIWANEDIDTIIRIIRQTLSQNVKLFRHGRVVHCKTVNKKKYH